MLKSTPLYNVYQEEKDDLQGFLTNARFDEYIWDMQRDGTYADHVAVQNVSNMLQMTLTVVQTPQNITIGAFPEKLYLGYIPDLRHYVSITQSHKPESIQVEQYYAVYYTDPPSYYIGRVLKLHEENADMKFLEQDLVTNTFSWPKRRAQVESVPKHFLFSGPVSLQGSGPFHVPALQVIKKKFNALKKSFKWTFVISWTDATWKDH